MAKVTLSFDLFCDSEDPNEVEECVKILLDLGAESADFSVSDIQIKEIETEYYEDED